MKQKKAQSTMQVIIMMALGLLVLFVLVGPLFKSGNSLTKLSACESYGGNLVVDSCNLSVSKHFSIGDDKLNNTCCKKRAGIAQESYDAWLKTAKVTGADGKTSSGVSTISSDKVAIGDVIVTVNGDKYENKVIDVRNGKEILFAGTHNVENGNYCELYILPAKLVNGVFSSKKIDGKLTSLPDSKVPLADCSPKEGKLAYLENTYSVPEKGYYKVDFVVRESASSSRIASATAFFNVSVAPSDDKIINSADAEKIIPTITLVTIPTSKQNKLYCTLDIDINPKNYYAESYVVYSSLTEEPCKLADYDEVSKIDEFKEELSQELADAKTHLCIKVEQPYSNNEGDKLIKKEIKEFTPEKCDFVSISSNTIPLAAYCLDNKNSCEELTKEECGSDNLPSELCRSSIDCYENARFMAKNKCQSCDDVSYTLCSDYKTEGACTVNNCLDTKRCSWKPGFIKGKCLDMASST